MMTSLSDHAEGSSNQWPARQVYGLATGCLLLGMLLGYLFRGSESSRVDANTKAIQTSQTASQFPAQQKMPSLDQMKKMGDKQAEPLLAKLKTDPNNAGLLAQIGGIYKATHQFKDAESYYGRSLKIDPTNIATRSDMAACLYYTGDVDGAIGQLQQSLKTNPTDANSLFNLGVIKWQGNKDARGAVAAWRQLLKSNPKLEVSKKSEVEKMIAEVGKGTAN